MDGAGSTGQKGGKSTMQPTVEHIERDIERQGVGSVQIRILAICAVVLALDGYDIVSMGFALPSLAEDWHMSPASLTTALVLSNVGMLGGALVSGPLGDRFGRKPVFLANILCFGVFSLLSALCTTVSTLSVMRFLTGLGLGGGVPLAIALCSDYSPRRQQPKLVAIMSTGVPVGQVVGGMIISQLIARHGWQSVFVAGGILPLLIIPLIYFLLPESRQFVAVRSLARDEAVSPRTNSVVALFRDGRTPVTLLLWVIFACNLLTVYLISLWLPTILRQSGLSIADAVFATTMFALGGGMMAIVVGWPMARFGAERVLVCVLLIGLAGTVWLANGSHSYVSYLIAVFGTGMGISGGQVGINTLAGAAYPARIRSSGAGWALGIGRLGNIAGPMLGGILLGYGLAPASIFMSAIVPVTVTITSMAVLSLIRPRTAEPKLHVAADLAMDPVQGRIE